MNRRTPSWITAAVLSAGVVACDRREPIASCTEDLHGVYAVEGTGERWSVLDNRAALEAYPLFDDTITPVAGLEIAPRVIDLRRTGGDALAGEASRRYMKGSARCDAKAAAHVTRCADTTLEVVLGDPLPPVSFAPCVFGQPAPSHRERWRRQD